MTTVALAVGSAILSGVQAMQSSKQAEKTAKYNSQVAAVDAENNRAWARYDANKARQQGDAEAGRTRSLAGASGTDVGEGSTIDILSDDAVESELNALSLELQGEARGRSFDSQSAMYQMEADNAKSSRPLSIAGAALSGYASGHSLGKTFET